MCGIVGMAGNLNISTNKMFRDMWIFDQVRGMHSSGIAAVGMNSTVAMVEKDIGCPNNLWEMSDSVMLSDNGTLRQVPKLVIGHNRFATTGKVTVDNAHPFTFGHITGVHNGSLTYWRDLEGHDKHDVDSQAIFDTIYQKGIDHCWGSFYGAACLVFWDSVNETLNIIRNDQRPLQVAQSADGSAIFWASEDWMIMVAASRNNVKLKRNENGKVIISTPEANKLYTYRPTATSCPLVEVRELKKKVTFTTQTTYGTFNTHGTNGHSTNNFKGTTAITQGQKTERQVRDGYAKDWDAQPWHLSTSWAGDWERGDKDLVGMEFTVDNIITTSKQGYRGFYILGRTKEGFRVEVYPTRPKEYEEWIERLTKSEGKKLIYKFNNRPRKKTFLPTQTAVYYKIGTPHISLVKSEPESNVIPFNFGLKDQKELPLESVKLYKTYNNGSVTEERWNELMNHGDIQHACSSCNNPISIEQHRDILWVTQKFVLCETCREDPAILSFVKSYNMG